MLGCVDSRAGGNDQKEANQKRWERIYSHLRGNDGLALRPLRPLRSD